jgi:hypothetical protein
MNNVGGFAVGKKAGLTGISIKHDDKLKKLVSDASDAVVAQIEDRVGRYGFVFAIALERVPGTNNYDYFHSMRAGQAGLETLNIVAKALRDEADRVDEMLRKAANEMLKSAQKPDEIATDGTPTPAN